MWQRLSKSYPLPLEVIHLFLVFLGFYLAATNYGSLPDRIPTHFGIQGVPDGWGGKSQIYVSPAVGAFVYVMFGVIMALFAAVKDPMKLINLPHFPQKRKAALTEAQAEELRLFILRALLVMKLFMMGLTTYLTYNTIQVAMGLEPGLGAPFFVFLAGILVAAGAMAWKSLKIAGSKPQGG